MCAPSQGAMLPYGLKVPSPYFPFGPNGGLSQIQLSALDFQRSQMNDYNIRVQLGLRNYQNAVGLSSFHAYFNDPYTQAYFYKHDPRSRFVQEEPKPSHSYIGLIGMAILNSKEKKLVLSDIYQWILDNYPYFRSRGPGWRNSIRHNLSLNDCFIKAGRSANGKGHYWAVHPANVEDFERGDFRRRRAQRKVRRHMGLSVPDDDDSPTPSPTQSWAHHDLTQSSDVSHTDPISMSDEPALRPVSVRSDPHHLVISHSSPTYGPVPGQPRKPSRKRLFDMASLLAPDDDEDDRSPGQNSHHERHHNQQIHVAGFMFHPIQEQKSRSLKTDNLSDQRADDCGNADELSACTKRTSSDSAKEMGFISDDDHENDEIQVTSGEDSPPQEHDDIFYTSRSFSVEDKYESDNSFNGSKIAIDSLSEQSNHTSSPHNKESKKDNALDLSSPTYFESEKKFGDPSIRVDFSESLECKIPSPRSKDNNIRLLQQTGQAEDITIKKESGCEKCSVYCGSEALSERCVLNASKANCSGCERMRQIDSDTILSKLPYRDKCESQGEQLCPIINGTADHVRSSTDKSHYYRSELQDPRRPSNQGHIDSNFGPLDNGLPESDRHNDAVRAITSDSSVFVSEASRVSSDPVRWTDSSKMVLSRDRLSAFSTLGIRNHNMYAPFNLRNFSIGPQRLVSATTPMRTGMSDALLSMSTSSSSASINLIKGMDSATNKNSHTSSELISSKNTNCCSNSRE